jgi:tRNA nucleotidyltransferase (CCA-adding enzyme)
MKVLNDVLDIIKPSKKEEKEIEERIKKFISRIKVKDAKIILGGSGAKGTWLKTTKDADIFIQFKYDKFHDKSDQLSDILEKQLKKSFKKLDRLHGSRDYFQVHENKFTFEIIPIMEIKKAESALNITDVSPLHADFVKLVTKKNKRLPDEIRLMKQFCKVNRIYGAESYINGFSGYMCELLVINYGSFLKLMKAASKWKVKEVIDIKKFYKNKNVMFELNKSKLYSPLILIDPVQEDRNAAAALSYEKFDLFIKKARAFVKKPTVKMFEEPKLDLDKLKKDFIVIEVKSLKGKEDVIGAKLVKAFNFINTELTKEGFVVKKCDWLWDRDKKGYFIFKLGKDVDKIKILNGPSVSIKEHVVKFKKKHKDTFVKKGVIYARRKRKITKGKDYIVFLIQQEYFKERVKSGEML